MAKVFTPEEREKIKGQVVELVPLSGRETLRALEIRRYDRRLNIICRECLKSEVMQ